MVKAISEIKNVLNPPLFKHLISPPAIGKLKSIIEKPFSPGTSFRVKANHLSTYFANVSKAYHSGKGDDFESVAVVFGNPYLPISLSDAGLVSNKDDASPVTIEENTTTVNNRGQEVTRRETSLVFASRPRPKRLRNHQRLKRSNRPFVNF